jgi:hypothetical protein
VNLLLRLASYSMVGADPDELRERLAAGLSYPGTPLPRRYIESVHVRVNGEWVRL